MRCEHDAVLAPGTYINVKALNEWESKVKKIDIADYSVDICLDEENVILKFLIFRQGWGTGVRSWIHSVGLCLLQNSRIMVAN